MNQTPPGNPAGQVSIASLDEAVALAKNLKKPGSIEQFVNWARKHSLWPMPFGTACCAIEFMGMVSSTVDISRFGAEFVRFSPRQCDLMIVAGTIVSKMAPVLRTIYDQMAEPKWVISMGSCSNTGGMFNTYSVLQGIDRILVFPMFPQFSCSTTGSIYDGATRAAYGRRCPWFFDRRRQMPTLRFVPNATTPRASVR